MSIPLRIVMKRRSYIYMERYGSMLTTPRLQGNLNNRRGQQLWWIVTRGESNYIQSCGTVIENKINTYNNGRWTTGYRIEDLRIGESRQMLLSARMQNPPQWKENGVFWCFGRGVFFVKALGYGAPVGTREFPSFWLSERPLASWKTLLLVGKVFFQGGGTSCP